jgi:hypothetical protein
MWWDHSNNSPGSFEMDPKHHSNSPHVRNDDDQKSSNASKAGIDVSSVHLSISPSTIYWTKLLQSSPQAFLCQEDLLKLLMKVLKNRKCCIIYIIYLLSFHLWLILVDLLQSPQWWPPCQESSKIFRVCWQWCWRAVSICTVVICAWLSHRLHSIDMSDDKDMKSVKALPGTDDSCCVHLFIYLIILHPVALALVLLLSLELQNTKTVLSMLSISFRCQCSLCDSVCLFSCSVSAYNSDGDMMSIKSTKSVKSAMSVDNNNFVATPPRRRYVVFGVICLCWFMCVDSRSFVPKTPPILCILQVC